MTLGLKYTEWLEDQKWMQKGDVVYVISDVLDLAIFMKKQGTRINLDEIIDRLQYLVGTQGTLLFPTFNWGFCKGEVFDYNRTPSKTGSLSSRALQRSDFVRTQHPIYSFAVWGHHKDELLNNECVNSFGEKTIFEDLYKWNSKVLVIGLPALKGLTYIHHVEQSVGVPYRYNKGFTGMYIDSEGHKREKTYYMYVRDLDMNPQPINCFEPLEQKMYQQNTISQAEYMGIPHEFLKIRELDKAVKADIVYNNSQNMYTYNNKA